MRRLDKNGFSKYKARDLNPAFAKGRVVEADYFGQKWRDMQMEFFNGKADEIAVNNWRS